MQYAYINSSKKYRSKVGPLKNDGEAITNAGEMAEILNDYYASVFTRGDDEKISVDKVPETRLEDIQITEEMVKTAIDKLKENSASGPDGIPSRVIKELNTKWQDH